jgi:hypothetical protein
MTSPDATSFRLSVKGGLFGVAAPSRERVADTTLAAYEQTVFPAAKSNLGEHASFALTRPFRDPTSGARSMLVFSREGLALAKVGPSDWLTRADGTPMDVALDFPRPTPLTAQDLKQLPVNRADVLTLLQQCFQQRLDKDDDALTNQSFEEVTAAAMKVDRTDQRAWSLLTGEAMPPRVSVLSPSQLAAELRRADQMRDRFSTMRIVLQRCDRSLDRALFALDELLQRPGRLDLDKAQALLADAGRSLDPQVRQLAQRLALASTSPDPKASVRAAYDDALAAFRSRTTALMERDQQRSAYTRGEFAHYQSDLFDVIQRIPRSALRRLDDPEPVAKNLVATPNGFQLTSPVRPPTALTEASQLGYMRDDEQTHHALEVLVEKLNADAVLGPPRDIDKGMQRAQISSPATAEKVRIDWAILGIYEDTGALEALREGMPRGSSINLGHSEAGDIVFSSIGLAVVDAHEGASQRLDLDALAGCKVTDIHAVRDRLATLMQEHVDALGAGDLDPQVLARCKRLFTEVLGHAPLPAWRDVRTNEAAAALRAANREMPLFLRIAHSLPATPTLPEQALTEIDEGRGGTSADELRNGLCKAVGTYDGGAPSFDAMEQDYWSAAEDYRSHLIALVRADLLKRISCDQRGSAHGSSEHARSTMDA